MIPAVATVICQAEAAVAFTGQNLAVAMMLVAGLTIGAAALGVGGGEPATPREGPRSDVSIEAQPLTEVGTLTRTEHAGGGGSCACSASCA